jgi:hypothetical protein
MMTEAILAILALGGLLLAGYAHVRLRHHTATAFEGELIRLVLVASGLGVGWMTTLSRPGATDLATVLAFVTGFGLVHLPAAFILWSKRQRGVYR